MHHHVVKDVEETEKEGESEDKTSEAATCTTLDSSLVYKDPQNAEGDSSCTKHPE